MCLQTNQKEALIAQEDIIVYKVLIETATDKDVLGVFMAINHTGAPMSPEHIEFIKSIKL